MYSNNQWPERREFQRFNLKLPIWYKALNPEPLCSLLGSSYLTSTTLDISPFGMAFMSKHNIPAFSDLSLKFVVGAQANFYDGLVVPIEVNAKVCSSTLYGKNEYRLGVLFSNIAPEVQKKLASFIRESL